jgi:hypothetical protein
MSEAVVDPAEVQPFALTAKWLRPASQRCRLAVLAQGMGGFAGGPEGCRQHQQDLEQLITAVSITSGTFGDVDPILATEILNDLEQVSRQQK